MDKEKVILDYMKKLDISREEAEQLWEDDQTDFIGEEGEEMTQKAKEIKNYVVSEKTKPKNKAKERKVDDEKKFLLLALANGLNGVGVEEITTENEVKLHFSYNSNSYSVTLTKHRAKKEK